jgi:tetratricopeptide (TPR) repeat protein
MIMAMANDNLFPPYIPRDEERDVLAAVTRVQESGNSEAILLYGPGGVGKTRLVRALPERYGGEAAVVWLRPVDLDDQEYWLLTNLQTHVARELDPDGKYFRQYFEYLVQPVDFASDHVTTEMAVSRIGYGRQLFLECYARFSEGTGKAVVMVFDTAETVRGMTLLVTLTQWMRGLPSTLFVLSGRPMAERGALGPEDPIRAELENPRRPMRVTTVPLGRFSKHAAREFLAASRVAAGLSKEDRAKIIQLTRGHPLWLALAVSYLDERGLPPEASDSLSSIERDIPFRGQMTTAGRQREEDFKGRMISPYREADFWHESIKRLAAVRLGVNEVMWQDLMRGRPLPQGVANATEAWRQLTETPWVRLRANGSSVTLHDAMAEELAKRVIPLHDLDHQWRRDMWHRAAVNCDAQITGLESTYQTALERLNSRRQLGSGSSPSGNTGDSPIANPVPIVEESARLDTVKRTIDQLKVQRFYYQLLSGFEAGCRHFLDLFAQAKRAQDLLLQDLLATAMRRWLAAGDAPGGFEDVDSAVITEFRDWLAVGHRSLFREISIAMADFLVGSQQSLAAIDVLKQVPLEGADARQLSRQKILLGNAYLRLPGQVKEGEHYLDEALTVVSEGAFDPVERNQLIAEAYKERGFYLRSIGRWQQADASYEHARDAILRVLAVQRSDAARAELASIQTNWAYVKGLGGFYRDGLSLVESAISMRGGLGLRRETAISHSTRGEVLRYEQKFQKAWAAYAEAERIFDELQDASWLGTIYQQQAICLFQAHLDNLRLVNDQDPLDYARELALNAVDICRERSVRNYPSALNRAGRIVAHTDPQEGLRLLAAGIEEGRKMSDGWFWLANIVEHAELCWAQVRSGHDEYREDIARYEDELKEAMAEYEIPDLRGRSEIVHAHLAVRDWGDSGTDSLLDNALKDYAEGFRHISERGHVGSSGTSVVPEAFKTFGVMLKSLPDDIQSQWLHFLRVSWSGSQQGSTMLLARLEELS